MNSDFDLDLPKGPELPSPPPMARDAFYEYWLRRLADFYQSPHYESWYQRTSEEMRNAEPFEMD